MLKNKSCSSFGLYHMNLDQSDIHPNVLKVNFHKITWKLSETSEATMKESECAFALQEYQRFLTLKILYPASELVPNKLVDEFWHAHILDTKAYRADCMSMFGYFLDHYPYFGIHDDLDYKNLVNAFEETKSLYERHFGLYPRQLNHAARCVEHACHVPSSCACRSPGTCK